MKIFKVLLCLTVLVTLGVSCKKDTAGSKVKKENLLQAEERNKLSEGEAKIVFDKEIHDFGTVNEGDIVRHAFLVTNSGDADLIIVRAKASCGCTIPTWPKEPVAPGESAQIKIEFDTRGKNNKQSKTITLTTNTVEGKEILKITGMVIPKDK